MTAIAGVVIICILIIARAMIMPWARRFDKKVADRRELEGKPRSIVPPWAIIVGIVVLFIGGTMLTQMR